MLLLLPQRISLALTTEVLEVDNETTAAKNIWNFCRQLLDKRLCVGTAHPYLNKIINESNRLQAVSEKKIESNGCNACFLIVGERRLFRIWKFRGVISKPFIFFYLTAMFFFFFVIITKVYSYVPAFKNSDLVFINLR